MRSILLLVAFAAITAQNANANFFDDLFGGGWQSNNRQPTRGQPSNNPFGGLFGNSDPAVPGQKVSPVTPVVSKGLAPGSTTAAVWETTNRWDENWEARYQQWVTTNWVTDIFTNPGSPYRGLLPDCADAVYSMRAIFASQNGLPFAVIDPSTRKTVLSNSATKFKSYQQGPERVTAFLFWLYDILGTTTLEEDSIPIAINRQTFHPGGFMLAKESKHSYTIKKLRDNGVPTLYYSTQANDGTLLVRSWPSEGFLFSEGIKNPSGIRYYRLPEDLLKPEWEVAGYSDEQYKFPAGHWIGTVQRLLQVRNETMSEELKRHMEDICQLVSTRVGLVAKADDWIQQNGNQCMGAQDYDDLSTPSRDRQMIQAYNDLTDSYTKALSQRASLPRELTEQVANIFAPSASKEKGAQFCRFNYANGRSMTLGEWRRRLAAGRYSSNPNEPNTIRWGDQRGPSGHANSCPQY